MLSFFFKKDFRHVDRAKKLIMQSVEQAFEIKQQIRNVAQERDGKIIKIKKK